MPLETWLGFTAASIILLLIPGPTVLLIVSYALGQGARVAFPMAIGVGLGDITSMTFSMLGLGALLATSATLFTVLKWVGAAYLVWLGIKLFRAGGSIIEARAESGGSRLRMIGHAWLVTALNPKGLTFFVAFLPQFMDPAHDFVLQMVIFEATFVSLAMANSCTYALLATQARGMISRPAVLGAVNRAGGSVLIAAGVASVALSRAR